MKHQEPVIRFFLLLFLTLILPVTAFARHDNSRITGKVIDKPTGQPLEYAIVELRDKDSGKFVASCATDSLGKYVLTVREPGNYTLKASYTGYSQMTKEIAIEPSEKYRLTFELEEPSLSLEEVVVRGLSEGERVARLAYNVQMMETDKYKSTTLDLSQVVDKISGIKIRETGGLGSDINVSLNGFSGKHVKIFIDGMPMDGMGSAFGLNNIPAGMAKRIEVYKGVVPIELGGDAIGGAINIVTDNTKRTRINASYSYGSFNTHKSGALVEHTTKKGFYFMVNPYQNYSDNDYKVNAKILDFATDNYLPGTREVRRFHGAYHNEAVVLKLGVTDKKWADRLIFGFIGGYEYKEIQNASTMDFVFGGRYNTATALLPSIAYEKKFNVLKGLRVSLNGNYNFGKSFAADTVRGNYNWLGQFKPHDNNLPGERSYMKYHYRDRNGAINLKAGLMPAHGHAISLSNTLTTFSRKGHNEVESEAQLSDRYPSENFKNVLGLSYKYDYRSVWNTSIFVKNYTSHVEAYVDSDDGQSVSHHSRTDSYFGGGIASTYFAGRFVQLKASYEHTYRLPTSRELFGDGDGLELGTSDLKPEASDNINLGMTFSTAGIADHQLTADATFQYRNVTDYIRRTVSQTKGTASSVNEGSVRSLGADFGLRYSFRDLIHLGGNFCYYDMRNMTRYKSGTNVESTIYRDRIPNQPYMYGNAEAGVTLRDVALKGSMLDIQYALNYIHEFYLDWPSYNGDSTVPMQLSHDIFVSYNFGKTHNFTVSLECRNIFNEALYDNFNLQKPGRSFGIKIGYNFSK